MGVARDSRAKEAPSWGQGHGRTEVSEVGKVVSWQVFSEG